MILLIKFKSPEESPSIIDEMETLYHTRKQITDISYGLGDLFAYAFLNTNVASFENIQWHYENRFFFYKKYAPP